MKFHKAFGQRNRHGGLTLPAIRLYLYLPLSVSCPASSQAGLYERPKGSSKQRKEKKNRLLKLRGTAKAGKKPKKK